MSHLQAYSTRWRQLARGGLDQDAAQLVARLETTAWELLERHGEPPKHPEFGAATNELHARWIRSGGPPDLFERIHNGDAHGRAVALSALKRHLGLETGTDNLNL